MLTFFRNFFKSKIGLGLTLAFLGLIAFAFASSDVANTGTFGGVGNAGRVATVGDESITTAELARSTTNAVDALRRDNPTLSIQSFVADGGLEQVLSQMTDRLAVSSFAEDSGLRAGSNLINSEIRQIGAFFGPSGTFDENTYRQVIRNQGLSDAMVRDDLGQGLLVRQLLIPAQLGASMPEKMSRRYAALFKERRQGTITFIPSGAFLPSGDPSDEDVRNYYNGNRSNYIRPERRILRYARFDSEAISDRIEPTDAAIQAFYAENSEEYAASEVRTFQQVIVPSREIAEALAKAAAGGASLDAAARAQGLRASTVGPAPREQIVSSASSAVADAYFAASQGSLSAPARSGLGWHVARVTNVERTAARTLAQARDEIAATLREQNRLRALADISATVEEQLDEGVALSEVAGEFGLEIQTTRPVTADGLVFGTAGEQVPEIVRPALATAFQMQESEPQIAEVVRGQQFLIFEVTQISESAAAPLSEIRDRVVFDWRVDQGLAGAREAADKILARVEKDEPLRAALQAEDLGQAQIEPVDLTRQQLAQQGAQRIPPPLALLFSMAQDTSKKLEADNRRGWFIVNLDNIVAGEVADNDPLLANARRSLAPVFSEELSQQFIAAMRETQGVERNEDAIAAVRQQLAGDN